MFALIKFTNFQLLNELYLNKHLQVGELPARLMYVNSNTKFTEPQIFTEINQ